MKQVLVTGATGFVGRFLCNRLLTEGVSVRGTLLASEDSSSLFSGVEPTTVELLGPVTPWNHALEGVDTIIHLAARLTGSLSVDSSKIRRELGWKPPFTMEEGLRETARWFKNRF